MEVVLTAVDQVALEGTSGITLTKLWYEVGRTLNRQLSYCQKLRIISHLLQATGYRCFYLDHPRKLSILPPVTEPLRLYGTGERHYAPNASVQFSCKNPIPPLYTNPGVADFGFCPDRLNRIEMDDIDPEDILEYDPDRLTVVASYNDRVRMLLPPDVAVEEQVETFSMFMILEYLAKCRERGAFLSELREDWASGLDVYALVSQAYKNGLICKESWCIKNKTDNVVLVKLSRFADRTNFNEDVEEKLPAPVIAFDQAMVDYRKNYPDRTSFPRKFLMPYFNHDMHELKKNVEYMKAHGYIKCVYIKSGKSLNKFGEEKYVPQLQRCHPKPKFKWSNPISDKSGPVVAPELIEPDQTMGSMYRDLLSQSDVTLNNISAYTGCMYYVARGVDKHFSQAYKDQINVSTVEYCKTFTKVKSVAIDDNSKGPSSSAASVISDRSESKEQHQQSEFETGSEIATALDSSIKKQPPSNKSSTSSKKSGSALWKDYITHDLSEFGIELTPEDFTFKHKFFRTDLQKLRRAVVLKHLAKLSVMEINSLAGVVGEVEKTIGLANPMWDRKSRKRFMDIMSSENLINQIGVKYDRNGLEREVHLIVLPGVDENHPLVHKLITDKATVRFSDKDKEQLAQDADLQRLADSAEEQQSIDLDGGSVPYVSMLNGDETASSIVVSLASQQEAATTEVQMTEQVHSVLDLESTVMDEVPNQDYALNGSSTGSVSLNPENTEGSQTVDYLHGSAMSQQANNQSNIRGAETICAPVWGSLGYSQTHDSPDIYFGQYVPTMHCARMLHSIILYKVWGVEMTLPPKYIESLDSFMLSPSVYGEGWLSYSDVMDMLPVKVLGMFLEKTALNLHFKCLGNLLYTSHEPIGLIHPTFRSCLVTNEAVVNRIWILVKLLCNLGCLSLLRKIEGERRKPAFIYVRTHTLFYDTRQVPPSVSMPLDRRLDATDFPSLEFQLEDSKSFSNYWDTLREVCVDTCMNELFANARLFRSKFFARKGTLYAPCSINLSRFYVQKISPEVSQCQPPLCYEFGAAGTEERMFLQDPCHWLFLRQANAAVKRIIKHLQEKGALNALQEEAIDAAVEGGTGNQVGSADGNKGKLLSKWRKTTPFSKRINDKVQQLKRKRDRQKESDKRRQQKEAELKAMVKASSNSGSGSGSHPVSCPTSRAAKVALRKREGELMRSQRKINWDINQNKYLLRVYWTPEEDAVLLYAYTCMHVFRIYHGFHVLPYGFFMRDVLHELLPLLASNKNEMACSRRFRYLMNNDYRSMLLFFALKAHATKTATVLDVLELSVANLSIDELYRRYKKLYNAVVRCNTDFISVDVRWNMRFIWKNFNMENFLPLPMVSSYWDNSSLCEKEEQWKESLFSSIQTLMLNFFYEKNINPYVASTIVLAKLLSVPSIAEIVGPVSAKLEKNILVSNSKMFKEFPIYRKFISNLVSAKNSKQINKLLLLTISRQPTSKSLVTIYEDKTFSAEPLKELLVHKRDLKCSDKERYCTFFYMVCLMDLIPFYNYRLNMKYPLFEFPSINLTAEERRLLEIRRERRAKKSARGGIEVEEEDIEEWTESDEEELEEEEEEGDSRIMQALPKPHSNLHHVRKSPGHSPRKGKLEAGEPEDIEVIDDQDLKDLHRVRFESERVDMQMNEEDMRMKEIIGFGKAELYRSYLAVTSQEKDQKIITNTPDISLVPREGLMQDQIEAKLNHLFFEEENYQQIDIKSVFDLVLVKSPSDCELLPKMPIYVTSYATGEQFKDCANFSESESIIFACIQNAAHDGLTFDTILQDYTGLTEQNLLGILKSLILKNAILATGDREIKFCAKDYCPFFTSLRSRDAVTAHKIPTDSSFSSIKFLPAAFLNWDGSFCTNMFATVLSWLTECATYIPGASFMDFHDRVCCLINPFQFLKLVKFCEKLNLIRVEIHYEELVCDNFFMEDNFRERSKSRDLSDLRNLYLFPVCDGMLRAKLFCEKFNLKRHLFYIGPQRLSLYASMNLYSTRKLFDTCLTYCDTGS